MRLSDLNPGTSFLVVRVMIGGQIGKRLADMGFTEGAEGLIVRGAFMRGPLQIRIRGYDILIRRGEAHLIEVKLAEGAQTVQVADTQARLGALSYRPGMQFLHEGQPGYRIRHGKGRMARFFGRDTDCCGK